jgi:hypothetical protein
MGVILEWIIGKEDRSLWTGCMFLRSEAVAGYHVKSNKFSGSIYGGENLD